MWLTKFVLKFSGRVIKYAIFPFVNGLCHSKRSLPSYCFWVPQTQGHSLNDCMFCKPQFWLGSTEPTILLQWFVRPVAVSAKRVRIRGESEFSIYLFYFLSTQCGCFCATVLDFLQAFV